MTTRKPPSDSEVTIRNAPAADGLGRTTGVVTSAKISRPRLTDIQPRPRITGLMDELSSRRLIWLSAPAGSGKSTAVLSWLQSRDPAAAAIWFQCDEGDSDVASFFHFMTEALFYRNSESAAALPRLSPELYPALPTFTRNFFREYFRQLGARGVVVFDNWQDIRADAPLREMLPYAVSEIPPEIVCVIISREDPPANLARLQLSNQIAHVGWDVIRLTAQETSEIARYHQLAEQADIDASALYETTQGWAVGLTALRALDRRSGRFACVPSGRHSRRYSTISPPRCWTGSIRCYSSSCSKPPVSTTSPFPWHRS